LFNANLFPETARHLEITQEEIGALAGIWRRNANRYLKTLEQQGLLRLEYGAATIIELERLRYYGDWKSRNVGGLIAQFQIDLGTTEYALDNSRLIRLRIRSEG
jgi:Crp-like helix-turn-helix domain